jgi:hypothetical protein
LLAGVLLMLFPAVGWTLLRPGTAAGAPPASSDYVKYYVVAASYQGKPENLGEIATRLLGTPARAQDIFSLNGGRVQPNGGTLVDPDRLDPGWSLVLPWDAVGPETQYGPLPVIAPAPRAATTPPAAGPAPGRSQPASPAPAVCAGASGDHNSSDNQWGTLRLAPDHAWPYSRGGGVRVAVVDSGVDASLPALSGRVSQGTDIISGSGRGDTDCLGSGTIMASIIAAHSGQGGQVSGVAPDATILPVRLVTTKRNPDPTDQAAAIQFAVTAGAKVIALGSYVQPADPLVAAAIAQAASHDAVVVESAPTGPAPTVSAASTTVLHVGGMGIDGALTAAYAAGTVDVVAPGTRVAGLGISGTGEVAASGTQYAVAFVAGQVALVRARYPRLNTDQVIRRIEATADRIGGTGLDPRYGWGLIDPGVSVTWVIPDEGRVAAPPARVAGPDLAAGPRTAAFVIIAVVSLAAAILLMLRLRWIIRPSTEPPPRAAGAAGQPPSAGAAGQPASAGALVARTGARPPPSTVDNARHTVAQPPQTGSDGAESARGIRTPEADRRTPVGQGTSTAVSTELGTGERGSGDHA